MKLASEREFKTVFLGITKKDSKWSPSACLRALHFFVDIAHWVLDHLLWNHVYYVLEGFFSVH